MDNGTVSSVVSTCLADLPSTFNSCVNTIVENPIGALVVGFTIFGLAIKSFRSIRH